MDFRRETSRLGRSSAERLALDVAPSPEQIPPVLLSILFSLRAWPATASLIQEERQLEQSLPMFLKEEGSTCACPTRLLLRDCASASLVLSSTARAFSKIFKECST